jgi:hypothetical protein
MRFIYIYIHFFCYLVYEAIGTAATPGLLCQPRLIVEWLWRSRWNVDWQGKPKFSEKTCPSATFVHHKIPHDKTRVWTRTAAVGSRRLTDWVMARPMQFIYFWVVSLDRASPGRKVYTFTWQRKAKKKKETKNVDVLNWIRNRNLRARTAEDGSCLPPSSYANRHIREVTDKINTLGSTTDVERILSLVYDKKSRPLST